MPITLDPATRIFSVPQSDLTFISGSLYEMDTEIAFRQIINQLMDDEDYIWMPDPISHNTEVTVAGITYARFIEMINSYSITFTPDSQWSVRLAGSNNNIFDIENSILNQNQVQVIPNNAAGLISSPQMVEQLDHLEKFVWLNVDLPSNGDGSQARPFNDATNAIDYAESKNIRNINLHSDLTLDRQMKNFVFKGAGTPTIDTAGYDIDGSRFIQCSLEGTFVGSIIAQECVLLPNCYLNGYYETCGLAGDLFCVDGGTILMTQCISLIAGSGRPTINMISTLGVQLSMRKNGGGITIKGCDHASSNVTVEVSEGSLTFDSSNTTTVANSMVARGMCKLVDQVPTAGVVLDETGFPANVNIIRKILQNKTQTDPITGIMTVFDDDGTTVLFTCNIWENIAGTTPYQGNGVDRREAFS